MKNTNSAYVRMYVSEVLGIKNYLCPESLYSMRALEGGLPCKVLSVVFQPLSSSQKKLLKKIMASINIFEYSVLEIKSPLVLERLISSEDRLADHVCLFGGKDLFKEGLLMEQRGLFISSRQKELSGQKPVSFLQLFPLEELDGDSLEVISRKKQVWTKLKQWKSILRL